MTEIGMAIHPSRPDLERQARSAGLPVLSIEALRDQAYALTPPGAGPSKEGRIVAICEYRDGSVIDVIRQ